MTSIVDLGSLRAAVKDFPARPDFADNVIDTFIDLAEGDIVNGVYDTAGQIIVPPLRCMSMEVRNAAFPAEGEYTNLPTGFLGFRSVKLVGNPPRKLEYVTPAFFNASYLTVDNASTAYTIEAGQLRLGPQTTPADLLDIVYYSFTQKLTTANVNWILLASPNTYLYGALRHLTVYSGMDSRLPFYQAGFIGTLASLHASQKSTAFSGVILSTQQQGMTIS